MSSSRRNVPSFINEMIFKKEIKSNSNFENKKMKVRLLTSFIENQKFNNKVLESKKYPFTGKSPRFDNHNQDKNYELKGDFKYHKKSIMHSRSCEQLPNSNQDSYKGLKYHNFNLQETVDNLSLKKIKFPYKEI